MDSYIALIRYCFKCTLQTDAENLESFCSIGIFFCYKINPYFEENPFNVIEKIAFLMP